MIQLSVSRSVSVTIFSETSFDCTTHDYPVTRENGAQTPSRAWNALVKALFYWVFVHSWLIVTFHHVYSYLYNNNKIEVKENGDLNGRMGGSHKLRLADTYRGTSQASDVARVRNEFLGQNSKRFLLFANLILNSKCLILTCWGVVIFISTRCSRTLGNKYTKPLDTKKRLNQDVLGNKTFPATFLLLTHKATSIKF